MGEMAAVAKEVARWKAEQANKPATKTKTDETITQEKVEKTTEVHKVDIKDSDAPESQAVDFKAYVDVPTMDDIEQLILAKKKQALMKRYASADMIAKNSETSDIVVGSAAPAKLVDE